MNAVLMPEEPAVTPSGARPHVTVRGLSKSFAGKPLYTDFNLDLPRNKIVSIFGPNGCVFQNYRDAVFLADEILLLTRRPTSIAEIVPFRLPRPRHPESVSDPEFVRVKAHTLEVFRREMKA